MSEILSNAPTADHLAASGPRRATAILTLVLGCLAIASPFVAGSAASHVLGLVVLLGGVVELLRAFSVADERARRSAFWGGGLSVLIGGLILVSPILVASGLALLVGGSFVLDGLSRLFTAWANRSRPGVITTAAYGGGNLVLGLLLACQWPISGLQAIGIYVGLRFLSAGWAMLIAPGDEGHRPAVAKDQYPDGRLGLPPHPEVARFVALVNREEEGRRTIDRYWQLTFLLVFFAIHAGRMSAEWNLVGLSGPFMAVVGDVVYAMVLALGIVTPAHLAWRWFTRPIERRAWARLINRGGRSGDPGLADWLLKQWLLSRLRFAVRVHRAYTSPTAALRRGLQVGLPLTAILIAVNPIWGLSWFFNTETWATGVWEKWVEYRVDPWRQEMVRAARATVPGGASDDDECLQVKPDGVVGAADFSFLVVGDPGEGDASQFCLKDQYLALGNRPDVKFLVVSSDVIYPAGEMKDYEANFYLPFKGFVKPTYAMPGNHDWYDSLEGFNANFLSPDAARAAMQARIAADYELTTTTERRIDALLVEAARLRKEYGVQTGNQRSPYFEVQADRFTLIVVDTGVLRTVDDDQFQWLRRALGRAQGKFIMVILGHPLYVAGRYDGEKTGLFADIHRLLREHRVEVVMAGDTHDFEFYREPYQSGGEPWTMHHFVNGGGGAYLSIGTALDWPEQPPVEQCGYYPRTDALTSKLESQTPLWKKPLWFWVKRFGAWPASVEAMAGAFDFNQAPFFQSFVEVRVEGSANRVRIVPYGVHGPLRWRDLQWIGEVIPVGRSQDDVAEFTFPMSRGKQPVR